MPSGYVARANLYRGWGTSLYAAFGPPSIARLHGRFVDDLALGLERGARILDIGCGPGDLVLALAARRPDLLVVGVDPAAAAIRRCRRRAASSRLANTRFITACAEHLPLPPAAFAAAVAVGSFKHWSDRSRGLAEIRRVLRPGGRLRIAELDPGAGPERFAALVSRYPLIAARIMRRMVLPCSLGPALAREALTGSGLALEREAIIEDLPFWEFHLRR